MQVDVIRVLDVGGDELDHMQTPGDTAAAVPASRRLKVSVSAAGAWRFWALAHSVIEPLRQPCELHLWHAEPQLSNSTTNVQNGAHRDPASTSAFLRRDGRSPRWASVWRNHASTGRAPKAETAAAAGHPSAEPAARQENHFSLSESAAETIDRTSTSS